MIERYDPLSAPMRQNGLRKVSAASLFGPLATWMTAYAEWLVLGCLQPPSKNIRRIKARELSRLPITDGALKLVERKPEFLAYVDQLKQGPLEQARAKFLKRFPDYVDAHHEALEKARAAEDYRAMAQIAEPVLDRVIPKKSENGPVAQVAIVLKSEQAAALVAPYVPPEVSVDVVAAEPGEPAA